MRLGTADEVLRSLRRGGTLGGVNLREQERGVSTRVGKEQRGLATLPISHAADDDDRGEQDDDHHRTHDDRHRGRLDGFGACRLGNGGEDDDDEKHGEESRGCHVGSVARRGPHHEEPRRRLDGHLPGR